MTEFPVRHFLSDEAVAHVGEGLLSRTLPREEWTHEAHLAATTYLVLRHPEIDLDAELPGIISRYNESVGGVNSDTEGYHDTITGLPARHPPVPRGGGSNRPIHELVNELLMSPMGRRDWPLRFWSKERLMSVEARRAMSSPTSAPCRRRSRDRAGIPLLAGGTSGLEVSLRRQEQGAGHERSGISRNSA